MSRTLTAAVATVLVLAGCGGGGEGGAGEVVDFDGEVFRLETGR